jgi:ankyrin repeat protein
MYRNRDELSRDMYYATNEANNNRLKEAEEYISNINVNGYNGYDDHHNQRPLQIASQNGFAFVVNYFIRKGADVNEVNNMGRSPLYLASQNGHYNIAVSLLNCPRLDLTLQTNYTALHIASENGHSSIVKMLLRKGIDVNSKDRYGNTPIMLAHENGKADIVSLLLSKGANIDFASPENKAIIIEYEKQKWENMFNKNKIAEFEQLDYKDKSVKNEYNKIKVSGVNQILKNKFIYMHDNDEFDWAQSLLDEFNEGEGKKRRKTKRKHKKRRKTRKY